MPKTPIEPLGRNTRGWWYDKVYYSFLRAISVNVTASITFRSFLWYFSPLRLPSACNCWRFVLKTISKAISLPLHKKRLMSWQYYSFMSFKTFIQEKFGVLTESSTKAACCKTFLPIPVFELPLVIKQNTYFSAAWKPRLASSINRLRLAISQYAKLPARSGKPIYDA